MDGLDWVDRSNGVFWIVLSQDANAAEDAAEPGASFISGRLAALEVAEGEDAQPESLDAEAAAAVRAELQAGLLAHAQGAALSLGRT
jgi:hypothetical protein